MSLKIWALGRTDPTEPWGVAPVSFHWTEEEAKSAHRRAVNAYVADEIERRPDMTPESVEYTLDDAQAVYSVVTYDLPPLPEPKRPPMLDEIEDELDTLPPLEDFDLT